MLVSAVQQSESVKRTHKRCVCTSQHVSWTSLDSLARRVPLPSSPRSVDKWWCPAVAPGPLTGSVVLVAGEAFSSLASDADTRGRKSPTFIHQGPLSLIKHISISTAKSPQLASIPWTFHGDSSCFIFSSRLHPEWGRSLNRFGYQTDSLLDSAHCLSPWSCSPPTFRCRSVFAMRAANGVF